MARAGDTVPTYPSLPQRHLLQPKRLCLTLGSPTVGREGQLPPSGNRFSGGKGENGKPAVTRHWAFCSHVPRVSSFHPSHVRPRVELLSPPAPLCGPGPAQGLSDPALAPPCGPAVAAHVWADRCPGSLTSGRRCPRHSRSPHPVPSGPAQSSQEADHQHPKSCGCSTPRNF